MGLKKRIPRPYRGLLMTSAVILSESRFPGRAKNPLAVQIKRYPGDPSPRPVPGQCYAGLRMTIVCAFKCPAIL
jgi:hypothetical protein